MSSEKFKNNCSLFLFMSFCCLNLFSTSFKPSEDHFYTENKGYLDSNSLFWKQSGYNFIRIHKSGYIITSTNELKMKNYSQQYHKDRLESEETKFEFENININFLNSNLCVEYSNISYRESYLNILKDNLKLRTFDGFELNNVYNNIDVLYSFYNGLCKLDWKINVGGSPEDILIEYQSSQVPYIDKEGNLHIQTELTNYLEYKPFAYQLINGIKKEIGIKYLLVNNILKFKLDNYDTCCDLIIDPIIVFSTYSGTMGDNFGFCATYDLEGNLYTAGIVNALQGPYPITNGAFQKTFVGCGSSNCLFPFEISISKYSKDGKSLMFASYLGGNRYEYPHSININSKNELIILGTTGSTNFPTSSLALQATYYGGGNDLFIAKISEDGSKLLASTYLGGNNIDGTNDGDLVTFHNDYYRGEIIEIGNNIVIGTSTRSDDLPTSINAFQRKHLGETDGYLAVLSSNLDSLIYATYYGGSGNDAILSMKLSPLDKLLYINGASNSSDLRMTGNGYISSNNSGETDGFISAFDMQSNTLKYSTFSGLDFPDQYYFIDFDSKGNLFATGVTYAFLNKSISCWGKDNNSQIIVKYNHDLSNQELLTTFGSYMYPQPHLSPTAFMVDKCDNIYLSAWGSGMESGFGYNEGTTMDLDFTTDAFQKSTDSNDFYLIVLSKDMKNIEYATFIGGSKSADHIDGGMSRFDKNGVIYQSVCASCPDSGIAISDFPVTRDALFNFNTSPRCNNASLKFDIRKSNFANADFNLSPKNGCSPLKVNFNPLHNANNHFWDFGNGKTSTDSMPQNIYYKSGSYTIRHIVNKQGACNFSDTFSQDIKVGLGAEYQLIIEDCSSEVLIFSKNDSIQVENSGISLFNTRFKFKFIDSGKYLFKISNPKSLCKDTIFEFVNIGGFSTESKQIENVFTPNGDGFNDCFTAGNSGNNCSDNKFLVFNRWGVELFDSQKDGSCWNGLYKNKGARVPDGTYYVVLVSNKTEKNIPIALRLLR